MKKTMFLAAVASTAALLLPAETDYSAAKPKYPDELAYTATCSGYLGSDVKLSALNDHTEKKGVGWNNDGGFRAFTCALGTTANLRFVEVTAPRGARSTLLDEIRISVDDGSGAFGCVAMNPPVMLPEGEALDIIEAEFKALGKQWSIVREDSSAWSLSSGGLVLTTQAGDIARDSNSASNIFLQSANCDWTAETKLTASAVPGTPSQNAGLVAYEDDDNFVKFVYSATFNYRRPAADGPMPGQLQLVTEEKGNQKASVTLSMADIIGANQTVWLRLVKTGDSYAASYSVDGKKFVSVGSVSATLKDVQAGMIAAQGVMMAQGRNAAPNMAMPQAAPLTACFDNFTIVSKGL